MTVWWANIYHHKDVLSLRSSLSHSLGKMYLRGLLRTSVPDLNITYRDWPFSASIKNRSMVGRLKRFSINSESSRWLWREWRAPKFTLVCLPLSCKVTGLRKFLVWISNCLALFILGLLRTAPYSLSLSQVYNGEICVSMPSICVLYPFLPPTSVRRLGLHVSWIYDFWMALYPKESTRW